MTPITFVKTLSQQQTPPTLAERLRRALVEQAQKEGGIVTEQLNRAAIEPSAA